MFEEPSRLRPSTLHWWHLHKTTKPGGVDKGARMSWQLYDWSIGTHEAVACTPQSTATHPLMFPAAPHSPHFPAVPALFAKAARVCIKAGDATHLPIMHGVARFTCIGHVQLLAPEVGVLVDVDRHLLPLRQPLAEVG